MTCKRPPGHGARCPFPAVQPRPRGKVRGWADASWYEPRLDRARNRPVRAVSARPHGPGAAPTPSQRDRSLGRGHLPTRGVPGRRRPGCPVGYPGSRARDAAVVHFAGGPIGETAQLSGRRALNKLLGLNVDLSGFEGMAAGDPLLGPLAARMRGLRPPRFPTIFEALVNGIACQQLSLTVGIHLLNRLTADRGRPVPRTRTARARSRIPRSSRARHPTSSSGTGSAMRRRARSWRSPD